MARSSLGEVADAVLEQVPHATGLALGRGEQPGGVLPAEVLGQDQDRYRWVPLAQRQRRHQALVGVGGWHPDVGDDDLGRVIGMGVNGAVQILGILGGVEDSVTEGVQEGGETCPHQRSVLGDHDAHQERSIPDVG